jgi:predicted component of viral defense system (DUF524 family)
VDIDKMHAYRDAIRDTANEHAVEFAAIIYPGATTESFGAGLEAISARPGEGFEEDLQAVLERAMRQPTAQSTHAA